MAHHVPDAVMPYLLFAGATYYPEGGAYDLLCALGTSEEALPALEAATQKDNSNQGMFSWAHLWNIETEEIAVSWRRNWLTDDEPKWEEEDE
jgi:hypothetical protein